MDCGRKGDYLEETRGGTCKCCMGLSWDQTQNLFVKASAFICPGGGRRNPPSDAAKTVSGEGGKPLLHKGGMKAGSGDGATYLPGLLNHQ